MVLLVIPRRHRRHLLLPPGLVALAWLLLGCVALLSIHLQKPQQAIMEIAFPNPKASAGSPIAFPTLQKVEELGPWRNIAVVGNIWSDYFDVKMVESACSSFSEEQTQHRALHVYIGESTSYNTFVQLLDIPHRLSIRRYWLDFRTLPYTFNLLGNDPPIQPQGPLLYPIVCGTRYYQSQTDVKPWRPFSDKVAEWLTNRHADLYATDWRNTWLVLFLLALLSIWRLGRQWRATREA